jgi:CysZ protein
MHAIKDHIAALQWTLLQIVQGRFILYFLPGIAIALGYIIYLGQVKSLNEMLGVVSYIPWIGGYVEDGKNMLFGWLEGISLFAYQFIIISLLSPFHTSLSEKVDTAITHKAFQGGWEKIANDIVRTLGVVILGGLMYIGLKLIWMLFAWAIGISFLNPIVSALLIGFFTGFNSYDYSLERHDVSVFQSWKYSRKHWLHMLLTGGVFSSLLFIPYIGVVLAPVVLTMVGTFCYLRIDARKSA